MNTVQEKNYVFSPSETPSVVGTITEVFRKRPEAKRSIHPTHSFCAIGPDAGEIVSGHFEASSNFGKDTPFHRAMLLKGKVAGLGISIGPVTIYHGVEDLYPEQFKNVYLKEPFALNVKLENGIAAKSINIHNPAVHAKRIDKDKHIESWMRNHLLRKNILHESKFGYGTLWWMDIGELFKELLELNKKGISIYNVPGNQA
jgi:aminoglycoside 3-N-acetyltransferase